MASTSSIPKSPLWRKPSDILKFHQMKSKKRILQKRFGLEETTATSENIEFLSADAKQAGVNPFRCSPRKRIRHNSQAPPPEDFADVSCDATLFQLLQVSQKVNNSPKEDFSEDLKRILANKNQDDTEIHSKCVEDDASMHSYLPFDWSLKTALRITSFQPFPWSGRLTTPEEASGVTGFVRCLPLSGSVQNHALDTSGNAQLYQCCQLWIHPSLPWLNLFPRNQNKRMAAKAIPLDSKIHKALHTDWTESFRSLFHLLRSRQCPYFYLCTHGFSVLFRAAGIASNPHIHALLTPTTCGFRAALDEDGIQFTMPLVNGMSKSEDFQSELSSDDIRNDSQNELNDDDEMLSWLKSVGVGGDMLAHLNKDKHRIKKGENSVDYRSQSLIYIEDDNVHALFNYLLNSKSIVPLIGPLVGIPPTLLSPVAFTGATLRPLKMKHCQAKQESQTIHMLDISGPILPHMMHYLNKLITMRVHNAQFDMKFLTLAETAPFSEFQSLSIEEAPSVFGQQSLSDCGLLREILQEMCAQRHGTILQEVHSKAGQYCWS